MTNIIPVTGLSACQNHVLFYHTCYWQTKILVENFKYFAQYQFYNLYIKQSWPLNSWVVNYLTQKMGSFGFFVVAVPSSVPTSEALLMSLLVPTSSLPLATPKTHSTLWPCPRSPQEELSDHWWPSEGARSCWVTSVVLSDACSNIICTHRADCHCVPPSILVCRLSGSELESFDQNCLWQGRMQKHWLEGPQKLRQKIYYAKIAKDEDDTWWCYGCSFSLRLPDHGYCDDDELMLNVLRCHLTY